MGAHLLFRPAFRLLRVRVRARRARLRPVRGPLRAQGSDARTAGFAVHERRRGEKGLGPAGTEADDADEGEDEAEDEWNDPDGIDIDDDG